MADSDCIPPKTEAALRSEAWRKLPGNSSKEVRQRRRLFDPVGLVCESLWQGAKARAARHGRPFSLTKQWIEARVRDGVCQATGIPLDIQGKHRKGRYHSPWAPSIDRIDPDRGYEPDNCQMVVYLFNVAKLNATEKELCMLAKGLAQRRLI